MPELVLWFGVVARSERGGVERALRLVPLLSAGLLESCDIEVRARPPAARVRVRLRRDPRAQAAVDRISASAARARGVAFAPLPVPGGLADCPLESADLCVSGVPPDELQAALDRAFAALWPDPLEGHAAPRTARRREDRVRYDPRRRELSLITDRALPVGERAVLAVRSAMTATPLLGMARAVAVRRRLGPGGPPGTRFVLTLAPEEDAMHAACVLAGAGAAEIELVTRRPPADARPRVLIVSEDAARGAALGQALQARGLEYSVATPGACGGGEFRPELAALDLVLVATPAPSRAEEVLRAVRRADSRPLPLVVSTSAPPDCDLALLRAGADAVIAGTASPDEVFTTIREVLATACPLAALAPRSPGAARGPGREGATRARA